MYNTVNKRLSFKLLLFSLCLIVFFSAGSKAAYGVTLYESEPNNTYSTADLTYDDYDNYGYISTTSDVDWWKVKFPSSGSANFWLGNIPSGCDYDLQVYSSNGTTLLNSSTNSGNANELTTINVSANVYYYIKIYSYSGSSSSSRYLFRAKLYPDQTPVYVDEQEPNDTYTTADITTDNADKYGCISSTSDVDWWRIRFDYSGSANFWLGNIPSGCDYELYLYSSNGTSLLRSSTNSGNANELITYNVSANTFYYMKITSYSGYSTSSPYLLRAKLYPGKTINTVPLYQQQDNDTCGCASGRMILQSFGILLSEASFKNIASDYATPPDDYTYVYAIVKALNHYLESRGKTFRYRYSYIGDYNTNNYTNLVLNNIMQDYPVQINTKFNSNSYFPYTVNDGHYMVIKGLNYTQGSGYYATINDPHYTYYSTQVVPIDTTRIYNQTHPSGGFMIHVVY